MKGSTVRQTRRRRRNSFGSLGNSEGPSCSQGSERHDGDWNAPWLYMMPLEHRECLRFVQNVSTNALKALAMGDRVALEELLLSLTHMSSVEQALVRLEHSKYVLYSWRRQRGGQYSVALTNANAKRAYRAVVTLVYKGHSTVFQHVRELDVEAIESSMTAAANACRRWADNLDNMDPLMSSAPIGSRPRAPAYARDPRAKRSSGGNMRGPQRDMDRPPKSGPYGPHNSVSQGSPKFQKRQRQKTRVDPRLMAPHEAPPRDSPGHTGNRS